ncbi:MAG: hypothetical protein M3018_00040 [Actinomycetota bacterium]|nr:hypothetical protein [Actinomycetota bacterium]
MRVLVVTTEPITATHLRDALSDGDPNDIEVMVVAPAIQQSPLKFWFSDADDAIAKAEEVRRQTLEDLGEDGVSATGDTGDSDPLQAIQDALVTFEADRIVLFTRSGSDRGYREDVDQAEIEERFGVPVETVTL